MENNQDVEKILNLLEDFNKEKQIDIQKVWELTEEFSHKRIKKKMKN